jgi:hypothetical protein
MATAGSLCRQPRSAHLSYNRRVCVFEQVRRSTRPLDPQVVHNGSLRIRERPVIGRVPEARYPVRLSGTPLAPGATT